MMMAFTYLPGFVTGVLRGLPTMWRGRHRLIFCWLVFIQAVRRPTHFGRDGPVDARHHHGVALDACSKPRTGTCISS